MRGIRHLRNSIQNILGESKIFLDYKIGNQKLVLIINYDKEYKAKEYPDILQKLINIGVPESSISKRFIEIVESKNIIPKFTKPKEKND